MFTISYGALNIIRTGIVIIGAVTIRISRRLPDHFHNINMVGFNNSVIGPHSSLSRVVQAGLKRCRFTESLRPDRINSLAHSACNRRLHLYLQFCG